MSWEGAFLARLRPVRTILLSVSVLAILVLSGSAGAADTGSTVLPSHVGLPSAALPAPSVTPSGPLEAVSPVAPLTQPGFSTTSELFTDVPSSAPLPGSMSVLVSLKPSADLDAYASEIQQPGGPLYNDFLTSSQVGQYFGAPAADVASLTSYFEGYGLHVQASSTSLSLQVSGSGTALEAAFHTHLEAFVQQYDSPGMWVPTYGGVSAYPGTYDSRPFFVNTEPATLPESLSALVSGVVGFDGLQATPSLALPQGLSPSGELGTSPLAAGCVIPTPDVNVACISEQQAFNDSYGNYTWAGTNTTDLICQDDSTVCGSGGYQLLDPTSIPAATGAYDLWSGSSTLNGADDRGQGVTVAVIEVGCIQTTTLGNFSQMAWGSPNQLLDRFTEISLPGSYPGPQENLGSCDYNGSYYGWNLETALDVEYLASMAPAAHIDLLAAPDDDLTSFDEAYAFAAQYLDTGAPCSFPASTGAVIVAGPNSAAACSVSITSNSYGEGELFLGFQEGSPLYLTVENQLLETLAVEGFTNFFASGDYASGTYAFGQPQADSPAIATGAVSVGGGQLSLNGPGGVPFPSLAAGSSPEDVPLCLDWTGVCNSVMTLNVSQTTGIQAFSYWSDGCYIANPFYCGAIGGGHGVSFSLASPWWQVANDTYSSGAKVDPVLSGPAAFNMSVYAPYNPYNYPCGCDEGWAVLYGGTSFATPILAGEWALIEEQSVLVSGNVHFGDISALLFWLHDANEGGIASSAVDPFVPMQLVQEGYDTANWDSFGWFFTNYSETQPANPNWPSWVFSIDNPAGSGWNFLQGLGFLLPSVASSELFGTRAGARGELTSGLEVEQVSATGTSPVTWLYAGSSDTFRVVYAANGTTVRNVDVWAYSGGLDQGTYGGGRTTFLESATGTFTWDPTYGANGLVGNYSEFGYFRIAQVGAGADSPWLLNAFSVDPATPAAGSHLVLAVETPLGPVTSGSAQITSFSTTLAGFYNLGGQVQVTLNGAPVGGAIVSQTSVNWNFTTAIQDPNPWPSSYWADGAPLGSYYTDLSGQTQFWANARTAETNGVVYTSVFDVQASYDGLLSSNITVWVEPQTGYYSTSGLGITYGSGHAYLSGTLDYFGMRYLGSLNISLASSPSDEEQFDCADWPAFCPVQYGYGYGFSDAATGSVPVNLTIPTPLPGQPVLVNVDGNGNNSLSGLPFYVYFTQPNWNLTWAITALGPGPQVALSSNPAGPVVSGTVALSYSATYAEGAQVYHGAVATLTLSSPNGTTTLATGTSLVNNGTLTYTWDTAGLRTGYYQVKLVALTPTGFNASTTALFYVVPALVAPTLTISPNPALTGETVVFAAQASGGLSPYTYSWSFGDGSFSAAATPAHVYALAGTYDVTVWVNDSLGQSTSSTLPLTVNVPPAPAPLVATLVAPSSTTVDSSFEIATEVTGGVGPYTYTYTGLPAGCVSQNLSVLPCVPNAPSSSSVVVKVTDRQGHTSIASTSITVTSLGLFGTSGGTTWLPFALLAMVIVAALLGALYLRERRHRKRDAPPSNASAWGAPAGGAVATGGIHEAGPSSDANTAPPPPPPPPGWAPTSEPASSDWSQPPPAWPPPPPPN